MLLSEMRWWLVGLNVCNAKNSSIDGSAACSAVIFLTYSRVCVILLEIYYCF